jgi:hypothetical protein
MLMVVSDSVSVKAYDCAPTAGLICLSRPVDERQTAWAACGPAASLRAKTLRYRKKATPNPGHARPSFQSWRPRCTMTATELLRHILLGLLALAVNPALADDDCDAPPQSWQPRSAVSALAQRNGWQVDRLKIDDGCYELTGRDAQGRRFKAKLHPASLAVIRFKQGRHEREHEREHQRRQDAPRGTASGSLLGAVRPDPAHHDG